MATLQTGRCLSCHDLKPGHLVITIAKLHKGIDSGCNACVLLKDCISNFGAVEEVREVLMVVDCALYLYVLLKDKSANALIIELYTDAGTLAHSFAFRLQPFTQL